MASGPEDTPPAPRPAAPSAGRVVARNVTHLLLAQVVSMAIAFVVTVRVARHLGPEDYGILFFANSFLGLGFTLADLGQTYYLVQAVARDHDRTGVLFASGMALRVVASVLVFFPMWGAAWLLGYPAKTEAAILATFAFCLAQSIGGGINLVFRGLERMDQDAVAQTLTKALYGVTTLAAVGLGVGVVGVILGQAAGTALGIGVSALLLSRLRIPRPRIDRAVSMELLREGSPYLIWSGIVAIHGTMDSILLSKLATEAAIGWYGASTRLTQILTLPAGILAAALFPTLSRLNAQSLEAFAAMTRSSLKWMMYVGGLAAAGTILFASQAVDLVYGGRAFGPTADILRVSSVFILCLFMNFVLGTAVMAAGRQKPWIWIKSVVVVLLVILNVVLIPGTQAFMGNGGVGAAAAAATAEVVLVAAAVWLLPRGTLDRSVSREAGRVLAGAVAMAAVKLALGGASIFVGIPLAVAAYLGAIAALGGVRPGDVAELRATFFPPRGSRGEAQ